MSWELLLLLSMSHQLVEEMAKLASRREGARKEDEVKVPPPCSPFPSQSSRLWVRVLLVHDHHMHPRVWLPSCSCARMVWLEGEMGSLFSTRSPPLLGHLAPPSLPSPPSARYIPSPHSRSFLRSSY